MAGLLLAIIYIAFISLGLPDSLVGSAWPEMYEILGVQVSSLGIITMITAGSTILASMFSDKLSLKFGPGLVTAVSTMLVAIAMVCFGLSKHFWVLCLLAIPYGLGAGGIDSSLNNYAALHYSSRAMSFLHAFWGVGAIISPYIMGYALVNKTYTFGFLVVGITQAVLALIFFAVLPLWKKCKKINIEKKEDVVQKELTFKEKFAIRGVFLFFIAFLAENAVEAALIQWIPSYFVFAKDFSLDAGAKISSFYFIGVTVSRMVTGLLAADKISDKNMIRLGTGVTIVGILMLFIPCKNVAYLYVSIGLIGFGMGPLFPAFIHSTPTKFGKENSLAIIGLLMAFGYTGSTFMPPLYGLLADYVSPNAYPYFLMFFMVVTAILSEIVIKKLKGKSYNSVTKESSNV